MYASVSTANVQSGKLDEFISTWRDSVLPLVKSFPGFKNAYVLTDTDSNKGIVISIYETREDAERTQSSGDYQKAVELVAGTIIVDSVVRKGYEVSIQG